MAWELSIHHIDLGQAGDSTIIVANLPPEGGNPGDRRTVLIDGGNTDGAVVDGYLTWLGVAAVDVIIVTHFDKDHYHGIGALLQKNSPRYDNAILYDCGMLPESAGYRYRQDQMGKRRSVQNDYGEFRDVLTNKVATRPGFRHPTAKVNSFDIVTFGAGNTGPGVLPVVGGNWLPPTWLIGKDVLWGNGRTGIGEIAWAEAPAPGHALNRPTLVCVSANKWVRQDAAGTIGYRSTPAPYATDSPAKVIEVENKNNNAKSLGFLLSFNNFRYYIAGDLESYQEDRLCWYLNGTDDMAGRVLAMKASHHGAETATSRAFVTRLRPSAAFISNAVSNRYQHPGQRTVNVLDGYPEEPTLAAPKNRHPPTPPNPPQWRVVHYLTGFQNPGQVLGLGGDASQTAGDPAHNVPGHVILEVSDVESRRPAHGQTYRGTRAAAAAVNASTGVGLPDAELDAIAEEAGVFGVAQAVVKVLGLTRVLADAVLEIVAQLGDVNDENAAGGRRPGIANAVKTAVTGVTAGGARVAAAAAAITTNAELADRAQLIGHGAVAAIAAAQLPRQAANVEQPFIGAATGANPPASNDAARAAAAALESGITVGMLNRKALWGADDRAYAVAAAFAAVENGASAAQAAVISAAITASLVDRGAESVGWTTSRAGQNQYLPARLPTNVCALAGAVAGAADCKGRPDGVRDATGIALLRAGFASAPRDAAYAAATLAPENTLFHVRYASVNHPAENQLHS